MLALIATLIVGYFLVNGAGYLVHYILHQPEVGRIHRAHKNHHWTQYPPDNYLSDSYRHVPVKDRPIYYYIPPALAVVTAAFLLLSWPLALALSLELVLIAGLNDWLHSQMHIDGHWLERFKWFHRVRELHWWHHVDESKNFGIFSWFSDRIFGTFEEAKYLPSYRTVDQSEELQPALVGVAVEAVAAEDPQEQQVQI